MKEIQNDLIIKINAIFHVINIDDSLNYCLARFKWNDRMYLASRVCSAHVHVRGVHTHLCIPLLNVSPILSLTHYNFYYFHI